MAKEKEKITITLDELVNAQAKAIDIMRIAHPATLLLHDEFTTMSAITAKLLFKEEK